MEFSMPTAKVVLYSWKFKEMVMMMLMEYDLGAHTYTGTLIRTYKPYKISSLTIREDGLHETGAMKKNLY